MDVFVLYWYHHQNNCSPLRVYCPETPICSPTYISSTIYLFIYSKLFVQSIPQSLSLIYSQTLSFFMVLTLHFVKSKPFRALSFWPILHLPTRFSLFPNNLYPCSRSYRYFNSAPDLCCILPVITTTSIEWFSFFQSHTGRAYSWLGMVQISLPPKPHHQKERRLPSAWLGRNNWFIARFSWKLDISQPRHSLSKELVPH